MIRDLPFIFLIVVLFGVERTCGQIAEQKSFIIFDQIEANFSPPLDFNNKFGTYRSPLLFYDGSIVSTTADWQKRRDEILKKWNSMMGEWPDFIEDQTVQIIEESTRENGITQYKIRFFWTPNETTNAYLLIPEGAEIKPAVVCVYYEPETAIGLGKPNRDFAIQLAKRGFVTLSIGTTKATKDKTYSLYYPNIENTQVEPLSMLAYAAANAWFLLSNQPEVDSSRIGIVGHSFGGKWAMFASCLFDKFVCAVWSDPGIVFDEGSKDVNYWEPWYLGYHPKPWRKRGLITVENPAKGLYPKLVEEGYDLHELHALMAPRPFLVSGGAEDTPSRWEALNHSVQVNKLLGVENRVAMTNRVEHSPNAVSNEQIYLFFEYFLNKD